ncbi:hypothetical protein RRF68_02305 [Tenacibaculum sp. HL-MS23]|uniref:hypothetical protein n=1 Tax=Tenacibaculum TaxID=104267 RepID=UPI001C4E9D23|nr:MULTISPECIES: hypothetical protein [Tenacibaculum]QXP73919.1 hypothetical protein H0I30_01905 [Tenacibaculum sp. AHE14PA]QXP75714.1 hypothetical protein H0I31_11075 [Tenacibaculum sp. AHE15PA]WNW02274.1 hypothetical protein RRF68_02305 [Tenacibaculum sp. HL-MS23]
MKKIIFTLAFMLVSSITFANNSVKKEEIKTVKVELMNNKQADMWMSTCTRTVTNSDTGESYTVSGLGFGSSRASARANCHSNSLKVANDLVSELGN